MIQTILITQCLQQDFIGPIGRFDPIPNLLHVGFHEAARLVGDNPAASPLNAFMRWAYQQSPDVLEIINVRDWHDPNDPRQIEHLRHFGMHALQNTPGAQFIFDQSGIMQQRETHTINGLTLNDFIDTDLDKILAPYAGQKIRVGVIGAWTEAKVSYLCYELRTRYPEFDISVCSALTASSSRSRHFEALDGLKRLLEVKIIDSVDDFVKFLGGTDFEFIRDVNASMDIQGLPPGFESEPLKLVHYLFRECSQLTVKALDGGFSGNYVLKAQSVDDRRRVQVPHVLKIGPRKSIVKERDSFYRVELSLGNAAPSIVDFADSGDWGAIKYRYASMDDSQSRSFQKIYMSGTAISHIQSILDRIFNQQLSRLYAASNYESCNLLEYYGFDETMKPHMTQLVESVYGQPAGNFLDFPGGRFVANPANFYNSLLTGFKSYRESHYYAYIHGDLNGANILEDGNKNIWLIDFFHTHYGHVIKDLIKLENDIQYIFTPLNNDEDLKLAMKFTDCLLATKDLATIPHFTTDIMKHPHFSRAAKTIQKLRSFYPNFLSTDIEPIQAIIGQMRYAMHTLSFAESSDLQKKWALYAAGNQSSLITERLTYSNDLQVANIPLYEQRPGKLGITILPGRRDRNRDLAADIARLKALGTDKIIALVTDAELDLYSVSGLMAAYAASGIEAKQISVTNGAPPTRKQALPLLAEIDSDLRQGKNVVVHCVGGLGRSGTLTAEFLVYQGMDGEDAIDTVRHARSPRAIENERQETSVRTLGQYLRTHRPGGRARLAKGALTAQ